MLPQWSWVAPGPEAATRARFTSALGADLTFQWQPQGPGRHRHLTWQTEYVFAREDLKAERRKRGGGYSFLQCQFARRWWAQGRWDLFGLPEENKEERESRLSALLTFVHSERSALRFQYSRWRVEAAGRGFNQYHLQLNFSAGSHPAHRYERRSGLGEQRNKEPV